MQQNENSVRESNVLRKGTVRISECPPRGWVVRGRKHNIHQEVCTTSGLYSRSRGTVGRAYLERFDRTGLPHHLQGIGRNCEKLSTRPRITKETKDSRAGISFPTDARKVWCCNLPSSELIPVDLSKPWMGEHIVCPMSQVSISPRGFDLHKFENDVCCVFIKLCGEADMCGAFRDAFV